MPTAIELVIVNETLDTSVIVDTDAHTHIVSKTPQVAIFSTDRICKCSIDGRRDENESHLPQLSSICSTPDDDSAPRQPEVATSNIRSSNSFLVTPFHTPSVFFCVEFRWKSCITSARFLLLAASDQYVGWYRKRREVDRCKSWERKNNATAHDSPTRMCQQGCRM